MPFAGFRILLHIAPASFKKPLTVLHDDIPPSVEVSLSDAIGIAKGGYASIVASQVGIPLKKGGTRRAAMLP